MGKLLAICGLAGSGKDTAAQALIEDGWVRVAFADPMREALLRLNPDIVYRGCTLQLKSIINMYGWDVAKRECPPIRGLLQRLGTEVGRELWGEGFWVGQAAVKVAECHALGQGVVITDARYVNEIEWAQKMGGKILRIVRSGVCQLGHSSETELLSAATDGTILNDGTVEELWSEVRQWTKQQSV